MPLLHLVVHFRVVSYIEHAKSSPNTEIVAGGTYDDSVGYFVQPTIVQTTTPTDRIFREEIFGPLMSVYVYPDQVHRVSHIDESRSVYKVSKKDYQLSV